MYRLLLADDEKEARDALSRFFPWGQFGFEVVGQADNGKDVLDFISEHEVEVVLCDIRMPVLSGIDVAKTLYESKSSVKIVFISGFRDFEYVQQALTYGVRNYILKPAKFDNVGEVFTRIKEELDEDRFADDVEECTEYNRTIIDSVQNMKNHLSTVSLKSVSQNAQMHPVYFSKYFKKYTGMSFSEYLNDLKMKKAAALLLEGKKIMDVSHIVGYTSPKSFARAFFSYYGCTPSDYKRTSHDE